MKSALANQEEIASLLSGSHRKMHRLSREKKRFCARSTSNCAHFMKTTFLFGFALLVVCGGVFAQSTHPGGIVYGPRAAFKIDAPPGWVLDNSAGVEQGVTMRSLSERIHLGRCEHNHVRCTPRSRAQITRTLESLSPWRSARWRKYTANPKRKSIP